ncbi:hypothetical protein HELRODRAFT_185061 [Helobdella robusta]|uniref:Nuclear protein localization protein 4 homolog n=1 Tax=Helobdella robusta TaxID=6412 RepID=T1FMC3_HELRO|nr:hypothetical protein HELRODRAFT_185061 [Helobdella robusta]ESN99334.1 hypothetical protein HELRODRAFT_185061 [Helobdella robusta]
MSSQFLLRIQSPNHGTKRVNASPNLSLQSLFQQIDAEFNLYGTKWNLWLDRKKTNQVFGSKNKNSISAFNIKHGDMLYLEILPDNDKQSNGTNNSQINGLVIEDEIDQMLWKLDGKIYRQKNEQLCRHGAQGKCLHCVPLEPYDEEYLQTLVPPIKFLSFHSYLRKLVGGVDKGKFAMLENASCKIKPGCKEHLPWPGGICTKCQPNAVTLQRQKYRHVDFIQFENPKIVDKFLDFWRESGKQRIGHLYGKYEHHKAMPLGIKAVVSAIYEPPQIGTKTSVELLEDMNNNIVEEIAMKLGLRKVGWIFTDLVPLDISTGSVKHLRGHVDSHFLSAEECIMAADYQNSYLNPCRLASDGYFGSKFVTVVVAGDSTNQIHFDGYQVSDQCMALVKDDCLVPTLDAPELGYIKESTNEQYVPDVFYKETDKYGNEVTRLARPLPVEYLLLDIAVAFPKEQAFSFYACNGLNSFPIENRPHSQNQTFEAFHQYMQQFPISNYMNAFKDFHLLIYMATCDVLPLKDSMSDLLQALKTNDDQLLQNWIKSEAWATVQHIMEAQSANPPSNSPLEFPSASSASGSAESAWSCAHCTYLNPQINQSCEMCNLPRS